MVRTGEQRPTCRSVSGKSQIALQCGGSDAFSGVSGNPLAAYVAKEVIRYGGCANLAETDELIGSEAYVLQNARDLPTARTFLNTIERFKERAAWHGHSTEQIRLAATTSADSTISLLNQSAQR